MAALPTALLYDNLAGRSLEGLGARVAAADPIHSAPASERRIMSAHSPAVAIPAPLDHATVRSIIIGIMLAMLLAALDQTIVATALPTIGQELGDVEHLSWVVSAYLLAATAVTP